MTTPPQDPTIDELRAEFARNDVHGWLWAWLVDVLGASVRARLATRYRPSHFSPSGEWDEDGMADLVSEFIIERGIKKGAILAALQRAESAAGCVAYLERSLHNFAISERVRTVADNVYARLRGVLEDDTLLRRFVGGPRPAYGLRAWGAEPPPVAGPSDLLGVERHLPANVPWVEYTKGARQSPGIAADDLRRIARSLITGTGRLMTARQIMHVMQGRFGLLQELTTAGEDTAARLPSTAAGPLQELVADELARKALRGLTPRQHEILRLVVGEYPPPSVREIATSLSMSKSLVSKEQQAIAALLRGLHVTERAEQLQVVAAIERLLVSGAA